MGKRAKGLKFYSVKPDGVFVQIIYGSGGNQNQSDISKKLYSGILEDGQIGSGIRLAGFSSPYKGYKGVHYIAFNRERRKTDKTQNRHFKKLPIPDKRNRVNPFGAGPKVPEFPKEAAY